MPGIMVIASQEREASNAIAPRAYEHTNHLFRYPFSTRLAPATAKPANLLTPKHVESELLSGCIPGVISE
jgi:hypothetical protein